MLVAFHRRKDWFCRFLVLNWIRRVHRLSSVFFQMCCLAGFWEGFTTSLTILSTPYSVFRCGKTVSRLGLDQEEMREPQMKASTAPLTLVVPSTCCST